MTDLLSPAASVDGLIAVAGKIESLLYSFSRSMEDIPQSMRSAREEMTSSATMFTQLQTLVGLKGLEAHSGRLSMISVTSLADTLVECVRIFSGLEEVMDGIGVQDSGDSSVSNTGLVGVRVKVKWMQNETAIKQMIEELRDRKTTLTLILSINNCRAIIEAQQNLEAMIQSMTKIQREPVRPPSADDSRSIVSIGSMETLVAP